MPGNPGYKGSQGPKGSPGIDGERGPPGRHGQEGKRVSNTSSLSTNKDGWMTCDFTSCSTVFQSYQDDGWMIIKGCVQGSVQGSLVYCWKDLLIKQSSSPGPIDQ